jgi:ADP-heptose:LPS heptosyltransferase
MADKFTVELNRPPRSIAVFRALKLGDWMVAIPAMRALRRAFPEAQITLVGLPWAREFADRFSTYFNEFIPFPGWPGLPEQPVDPVRTVAFLREMQERRFDVVLQLQGNGTLVNPLVALFNARLAAGYFPETLPQYRFDERFFMRYPALDHEVVRHVRLMEFLGIPAQGFDLEFPLTPADEAAATALSAWPQLAAGPFVCLHPGGISARLWPAGRFAEVADALADRGLTVVLTGTEPEAPVVREVRERMRHGAVSLVGETTLGTLGWVLSRAALLVSNDTGVSHVAAALRVPSVVVYTTSQPSEWAPLNARLHRAVPEAEADPNRVLAEALAVMKE